MSAEPESKIGGSTSITVTGSATGSRIWRSAAALGIGARGAKTPRELDPAIVDEVVGIARSQLAAGWKLMRSEVKCKVGRHKGQVLGTIWNHHDHRHRLAVLRSEGGRTTAVYLNGQLELQAWCHDHGRLTFESTAVVNATQRGKHFYA